MSNAKLDVYYNEIDDVLIVEKMRYSGEFFRTLALAEPGTWIRVEEKRRHTLDLFKADDILEKIFDAMTGRKAKALIRDANRGK